LSLSFHERGWEVWLRFLCPSWPWLTRFVPWAGHSKTIVHDRPIRSAALWRFECQRLAKRKPVPNNESTHFGCNRLSKY
jgi:hypothetical protein